MTRCHSFDDDGMLRQTPDCKCDLSWLSDPLKLLERARVDAARMLYMHRASPSSLFPEKFCGLPAFYLTEIVGRDARLSSKIARHLDGSPIHYGSQTHCDSCGEVGFVARFDNLVAVQ